MKEKEKVIEKAIKNTKASLAVEGLYLSSEEEKLMEIFQIRNSYKK